MFQKYLSNRIIGVQSNANFGYSSGAKEESFLFFKISSKRVSKTEKSQ